MMRQLEGSGGDILAIEVSGKETGNEIREMKPMIDELFYEQGRIKLLIVLKDFHGCSFSGFWEEVKLGFEYYKRIDKIAIVGDQLWERIAVKLDAPFEYAEEKYFDIKELDKAWEWIREPVKYE